MVNIYKSWPDDIEYAVTKKWYAGSKIKMVSKNGQTKYPLTLNNIYEVISESKNGTFEGVTIVNDHGVKAKYKKKYFEFISGPDVSALIEELRI